MHGSSVTQCDLQRSFEPLNTLDAQLMGNSDQKSSVGLTHADYIWMQTNAKHTRQYIIKFALVIAGFMLQNNFLNPLPLINLSNKEPVEHAEGNQMILLSDKLKQTSDVATCKFNL